MSLNIDTINKLTRIGFVTTASLGELCLFSPTVGDMRAVQEGLKGPISQTPKIPFLRRYFRQIGFPKSSLQKGENKPSSPVLTDADVESLTDADMDLLSERMVSSLPYLWRENLCETKTDDNGHSRVVSQLGKTLHLKEENESHSDFFYRLQIIQDDKYRKQHEKLFKSIQTTFSPSLSAQMEEMVGVGTTIRENLTFSKPTPDPVSISSLPSFFLRDNKVELLSEISVHLDTLIEATETATTFATKANEIQMGIAEELKSSSDQTSDFSKANIELTKQNIHLTRIVIGLTAMSIILPLVITIYSLWSGGVECSKQREFTIQNVNLIADKIGHLSETLSTDAQGNISALKDQIRAANTAINALKSQNDDLRKLRETDAEGLKVLKDAHQKLQKDVDDARQKNTNSSRSAQ